MTIHPPHLGLTQPAKLTVDIAASAMPDGADDTKDAAPTAMKKNDGASRAASMTQDSSWRLPQKVVARGWNTN
jgi:hypothetical protein